MQTVRGACRGFFRETWPLNTQMQNTLEVEVGQDFIPGPGGQTIHNPSKSSQRIEERAQKNGGVSTWLGTETEEARAIKRKLI
mmetsp:Transcript_48139/g.119245  ORF Transcript_48139/g.119245 Transcript_48139/m.119245 type:complete len:83 (-) Transcript_48139:672-920(-)